jgi:DNA polymerase III epsilon subunit-like protein
LETSESDARKGRIIQIAVTACDSNLATLESASWFVDREGNSIRYWASRIHGITEAKLDGCSPPSQRAVFTELMQDFIPRHFGPTSTAVLVAHNGFTCDFKWLIHTCDRLNLELPKQVSGDVCRVCAWVPHRHRL